MKKPGIIIIGAGGHGKVVAESIQKQNKYTIIGFCDDTLQVGTIVFDEIKVISNLQHIGSTRFDYFITAIGNNKIRKKIFTKLKNIYTPASVIHPYTEISHYAVIKEGSVILPGAVISYGVHIDENCIIGSNVHIDHESQIGAHSHIRNGSSIGSNCVIGCESSTDTGEDIQPFSHIKMK
jgi:sugar O-acyltransferase (sialic acid O-acetyltransferase NeuD family)